MASFRKKAAALAVLCLLALPVHSAAAKPPHATEAPDKLTEMFVWLNAAMRTPGAYTSDAFAQRVTADAALVIDGIEVMRTPGGWAARFHAIQNATDAVELVLPFRHVLEVGDKIYSYHIIRVRAHGQVACILAAGHAELRGDLISKVTLVRAQIDPRTDKDCWKR